MQYFFRSSGLTWRVCGRNIATPESSKYIAGAAAMFQQEHQSVRLVHDLYAHKAASMNVLAYKSVAVAMPTDAEIQELSRSAQRRNKAEGLTGVLMFDRGKFFQWLEGPTEALERIWNCIARDSRHCQIQVLRDEPCSERLFEGWDLRMVVGSIGCVETAVAALDSPGAHLKDVVGKPKSIANQSLEGLFSSIVIPRLLAARAHHASCSPNRSTAQIWHAEPGCAAKLALQLISSESNDSRRYVDSFLDQGASFNALYHEVFEPAQLQLGKLSDEDQCDDFHLTIALARLQMEIRRVNAAAPSEQLSHSNQNVLLCPQPREPHSVGLFMSAEVFNRRGWEVDCEFPPDDQSLNALVHRSWFDVLHVSQSGSLRRDSRLASMRATIDSARSASLNPSLIVMVDGRTFLERPQVYRAVHANAMSRSALDAVSVAEKLISANRSLATALSQVSVA